MLRKVHVADNGGRGAAPMATCQVGSSRLFVIRRAPPVSKPSTLCCNATCMYLPPSAQRWFRSLRKLCNYTFVRKPEGQKPGKQHVEGGAAAVSPAISCWVPKFQFPFRGLDILVWNRVASPATRSSRRVFGKGVRVWSHSAISDRQLIGYLLLWGRHGGTGQFSHGK